jgi:hypothetical protein
MSPILDRGNWNRVRFGDVADRSREQASQNDGSIERYVAGGHFDAGAMKITRYGEPEDGGMGSTFTYVFHPGQVLYVSASWYLRKVGVADFDGVVADKTYVLETRDPSVLDQRFLAWILLSDALHDYAAAQSTGSMNARLLWSTLSNFEFALPPLDEQSRIADLLWSFEEHDCALTELSKSLAVATNQYLSAQLGSGDKDISEYADVLVGFAFPSSSFSREKDSQSRLLVRGINVGVGATRWDDSDTVHWTETLTERTEKFVLAAGDIVIPMDRPFTADGRLRWAQLGETENGALLVQRVARLRPHDDVGASLIRAIVRSSPFQSALNLSLTGSFAPHLAHGDFVRYKFEAPASSVMALNLSKAESAEANVEIERRDLYSLRRSLMAEIFGEN